MSYKTIIIANIAESFEGLLNKIKNPNEKTEKIRIAHNLCDRSLLWERDDKVLVTSSPISPLFFENTKKVLNFSNCINIFPKRLEVNLSEAIIKDKDLMKIIIGIIKNNPGINISTYAVTASFICLVNYLRKKNFEFTVKEKPSEYSDWTIQFLDSKVGSRIEIDKIESKYINTPQSIICNDKNEAISVVEYFYKKNISCVIKANFGESGWGTLMIKKENYKSWDRALEKINKEFIKDPIWNDNLILVEEYIMSKGGSSGGCPSSELFLSDEGAQITYICDQIVTNEGKFLGIALGRNLLDKKIKNQVNQASMLVGKRFWELGYRGFFDIDFVLSKRDRVPYIVETNTRRTGGTHVYDTVKTIFGENWEHKCFCISYNRFTYGKEILSVDEILYKLSGVLYPINNKKRGIILTLINRWKPIFGFIAVGINRKDSIKLYNNLAEILSTVDS